jgi:hypothetical protein
MCKNVFFFRKVMQAHGTVFRCIRQLSIRGACEHKWRGLSYFLQVHKAYISRSV